MSIARSHAATRWRTLTIVGLLVAAGCSKSPEALRERHLERGDRYARQQQFREAIIEYRNVLQQDPVHVRATRQLALLYYELGEPERAFPHLLKAEQIAPEDLDVRLKLGAIYVLAGKADEARGVAAFVLTREPRNLDGLALLASVAASPADMDDAVARLEAARVDLGDRAKLHVTLGSLYLRKRDLARAERSFQAGVAAEPTSVEVRSALGSFYLATRDHGRAERELKAAADMAPIGSPARMRLVDFYLLAERPDEAKRLLSESTEKAPNFLPAWRRRAEVAFQERRYDESLQALQPILKKHASDREGRLLQGRARLARRETAEAIQEFQHVLKLDPRSAPAHYHLGLAQLQAGNVQQARTQLKEAVSISPDFNEAVLLLAELNIYGGALPPAIEDLERLLARHPTVVRAHVLLGSAYLARREPVKATAAFRTLVTLVPKDPHGPYLVGVGLRAQGKALEARNEFEAALALTPGYAEPLAQLVAMALAERRPEVALSRVRKQIAAVPPSGRLQHLLGVVHLALRDHGAAEDAFLRAIEVEPELVGAYVALGRVYGITGRYDEALAKLNRAIDLNPRALHSRMLVGIVRHRNGDLAGAQESYEALLTLNPRFAPAANNLAWMHSEQGGDKDKALQLAQTAREAAPEDPHVADTLGWIFYQRGLHQRALGLLKESATKLPGDPVVQYHLGLASLKVGDTLGARKALGAAINSPVSFADRGEARRALADVK